MALNEPVGETVMIEIMDDLIGAGLIRAASAEVLMVVSMLVSMLVVIVERGTTVDTGTSSLLSMRNQKELAVRLRGDMMKSRISFPEIRRARSECYGLFFGRRPHSPE